MPSSSTSGASNDVTRLNMGFSQMLNADPVATALQRGGGLLVGKAELLGARGQQRHDVRLGCAGLDVGDGHVNVLAAPGVGVALGSGGDADDWA